MQLLKGFVSFHTARYDVCVALLFSTAQFVHSGFMFRSFWHTWVRFGLACAWITVLLLGISTFAQARDGELHLDLKLGMESDTNALREEGQDKQADLLGRYFLKVESNATVGSEGRLWLKFRSGGKFYESYRDENALLNQANARYVFLPLQSIEARWLYVYVYGNIKDRTEKGSRRDYLRLASAAGLGVNLGPVSLSGGAGLHTFGYKPDPRLSFDGTLLEATLSGRITDAWVLQASYNRTLRGYESVLFVQRDNGAVVIDDQERLRADTSQVVSGGVSYRGSWILSAELLWLSTRSNSHGQSLDRYGAALTGTFPLFWDILCSTRLSLQRTLYDDEIFLDETLAVDEDNRNVLVVELERPVSDTLSLVARYSLYAQEFGSSDTDYSRQLFFLGMGLDL